MTKPLDWTPLPSPYSNYEVHPDGAIRNAATLAPLCLPKPGKPRRVLLSAPNQSPVNLPLNRLILETFSDSPTTGRISHIDGDPSNCALSNLTISQQPPAAAPVPPQPRPSGQILDDSQGITVAETILRNLYSTPDGAKGLCCRQSQYYVYDQEDANGNGKWQSAYSEREIRGEIANIIGRWHVQTQTKSGPSFSPLPTSNGKMTEYMISLEALVNPRTPGPMPFWIGKPNTDYPVRDTIATTTHLHNLRTQTMTERPTRWFDTAISPVTYDPDATCPTFDACLAQWSGKNATPEWGRGYSPGVCPSDDWTELLLRVFAYALLPRHTFGKIPFLYGESRSGKSTAMWLLQRLLGGSVGAGGGYMQTDLQTLAHPHGRQGLDKARVVCLAETADINRANSGNIAQTLKLIVGNDPLPINPKNIAVYDCEIHALPVIVGNELPLIKDPSNSFWNKIVFVPFEHRIPDADQKDDVREALELELPGILNKVLAAGHRLLASTSAERWCHFGHEYLAEAMSAANPIAKFVNTHCVEHSERAVDRTTLHRAYCKSVEEGTQPLPLKGFLRALRQLGYHTDYRPATGDPANRPYRVKGLTLRA